MARAIDADILLEKLQRMIDYCKNDNQVNGLTALFQVGDAIMDCPTLTPPNEWVSVEERLPEPTYCVLVYTTDFSIEVDAIGSDGEWMSYEVTHWMPLPAPPGKEDQQ